jgi:glycosyltransferase involved in cell wall biosynthesis
MTRGLYIGQLDSDDCLKPGAVRTLATYLDENPDVACCYGSCERVDADGNYLQKEYSWPIFSREKMMITSIAHHFRMFRRQAWERTEKFREDIINAVDYDMFLKLSEVGKFKHIDEILYQRRWHGSNTSNVNEGFQTANTHRVQREALKRQGLLNFWDIHLEKPDEPRRVSYRRRAGTKLVMFWPFYRANPYQRLLYAPHADEMEICAGTIDAALREIRDSGSPEDHIFHVHWLNFVFTDDMSESAANEAADEFLAKIELFKTLGGTVYWTIHNVLSHDASHRDIEVDLSTRLAELVDVLHFHTLESVHEAAQAFSVPMDKVRVANHGNYIGAYPDFVTPEAARAYLGLEANDDVILFNGQVRGYKGIDVLIDTFRTILAKRPTAVLVIAGAARKDPFANLERPLSKFEQSRIRFTNRYIDDAELQVFLRAADFAVYPYKNILTSGSLMLALSFGLPVIIPGVAMTRAVLANSIAGITYDGSAARLEEAIARMLDAKDSDQLTEMKHEARRLAESFEWQRLF